MFEYVIYHPYYVQSYMYTIQNIMLYEAPCFRNITADGETLHALPALGYFTFIKAIG